MRRRSCDYFYKTGEKSALKLEERLREEIVHKNINKHFI